MTGRPVAAVATAPGPAGIAVVRLSGEGAFEVADALCAGAPVPPSRLPGRSFRLFRVRDPRDGSFVDEAVVLVFRAPHSFTGEDVAEFQVHGGRASSARILDATFAAGAVPAGPGEFSRRAFLNGRLPLDRAEAVMDLVSARGDRAARAAAEQLSGAIGRRADALWNGLVSLCADVEATLDFTDEEAEGLVPVESFEARVAALSAEMRALADTSRQGRMLREGALVVIAGEPNVGKSTLFNALLGADRAIVNPEAGTTRDSLEESLLLDGVPLRLVDTAGLRETDSAVEREGVARARALASGADLTLLCECAADQAACQAGGPSAVPPCGFPGPALRVYTKSDLAPDFVPPDGAVAVSAATGAGMDALRAAMSALLGTDEASAPEVAVSERHAALLREAAAAADEALALWRAGGEDAAVPAAARLRAAADSVGRITGRVWEEDLLDAVFSRFCVGK